VPGRWLQRKHRHDLFGLVDARGHRCGLAE
jgi:hypothetical protein